MLVAIVIDRSALDEFHHQVRNAIFRRASVDQSRDVGMIERGQNLTFVAEAIQDPLRVQARAYKFDGHLLVVLTIGALGPVDVSHSALTNFFDQAVNPCAPADASSLLQHRHSYIKYRLL